jgi:hypothetical protein
MLFGQSSEQPGSGYILALIRVLEQRLRSNHPCSAARGPMTTPAYSALPHPCHTRTGLFLAHSLAILSTFHQFSLFTFHFSLPLGLVVAHSSNLIRCIGCLLLPSSRVVLSPVRHGQE